MSQPWIDEIDHLRGLAFLAVALQHTLGALIILPGILLRDALTLGLIFNISKFAVPLFIFVSGMVLSYNHFPRLTYLHFLRKRGRELLIPYSCWTLIYIAYYSLTATGHLTFSWNQTLYQLATGNGCYHLWFIILMAQFYLAVPLFFACYRWLLTGNHYLWLIPLSLLYLVLMGGSYYLLPGLQQVQPHWLDLVMIKFRDRNLIFWSLYFVAGGVAGLNLDLWRSWVKRNFSWQIVIWLFLFGWVFWELWPGAGLVNLNISTTLKPSMTIYTCSSIIILYSQALNWRGSGSGWSRLLQAFGRYSLGAYFIHPLTLSMAVILLHYLWPGNNALLVRMLVAWVICVGSALGLVALLSKVPGGSLLFGRVRQSR